MLEMEMSPIERCFHIVNPAFFQWGVPGVPVVKRWWTLGFNMNQGCGSIIGCQWTQNWSFALILLVYNCESETNQWNWHCHLKWESHHCIMQNHSERRNCRFSFSRWLDMEHTWLDLPLHPFKTWQSKITEFIMPGSLDCPASALLIKCPRNLTKFMKT